MQAHIHIFEKNTHAMTDSLTVANAFGRQHAEITQRAHQLDCSREFFDRNFCEVKHGTTGLLEMTQAGFAMLMQHLIGTALKERFIAAFEKKTEEITAAKCAAFPARHRVLVSFENGVVKNMKPVPADSYIVNSDNVDTVIKQAMPDKVLIDKHAAQQLRGILNRLGLHDALRDQLRVAS